MLAKSTGLLINQEADSCLVVGSTNKTSLKSDRLKIALIQAKLKPSLHQVCQVNQFNRFKNQPQQRASFPLRPPLKISSSKSKCNSRPRELISNSTTLCAILLQISLLLRPSQFHLNQCKSVAEAAPGQYVASFLNSLPDDLDLNDDVGPTTTATASSRQHPDEASGRQSRSLIEYLQSLPILSVGLKHKALIECNPIEEVEKNSKFKLVWLKLVRNNSATKPPPQGAATDQNDITLLSVAERLVSPDKRFRVQHQPPSKWTLTIDNVNQNDDKTYFLCQAAGGQLKGTSFLGGAQLNVLVPPKVVELETSPSLVQVDEFGQLRLQCKVISEPQSQISWRREDGQSLDGFEQRFRHHTERRPPHQVVSVDSGELFSSSMRRDQAGAYLCIASNGVQPGVSQRISVLVVNCRQSADLEAKSEPCGQLESANESVESTTTTTTTTTSTTKRPHQLQQSSGGGWSTSARQRAGTIGRANASTGNSTSDQQVRLGAQQQQLDKSRGSRYNLNQQQRRRGSNQTVRERRPAHVGSDGSNSSSSLPSNSIGNWQLLLAAFAVVWSLHCAAAESNWKVVATRSLRAAPHLNGSR